MQFYNGLLLCLLMIHHTQALSDVDAPKISSVTTTFLANITVVFDPGPTDGKDHFTVSLLSSKLDLNVCKVLNRTEFEGIQCRNKKCKTSLVIQDGCLRRNVTIVVSKQRSGQKVETNLILIDHIIPGPVTRVNVIRRNATSASLKFCAPHHAYGAIFDMKIRKHPLTMTVLLVKTQGFYEEREFSITFDYNWDQCAQILLMQLTPFTRYDLSLSAAGGGGSGEPVNKSFITGQTAPLSPPKDISYWTFEDTVTVNKDGKRTEGFYSLHLNWKPIPHDDQGGKISYEIIVSGHRSKVLKRLNVTEPLVTLRKVPDTPIILMIRAVNNIGKSEFSSIVIQQGIPQLESHVEIQQGQAQIFVQKPPPDVKIFHVYACVGHQNPELPCKDPLQRISSDETDFDATDDLISAIIKLNKGECPLKKSAKELRQDVITISRLFGKPRHQNLSIHVFRRESTFCSSFPSHNHLKFMYSLERSRHQLYPFKCIYNSQFDVVRLDFDQILEDDYVSLAWKQGCDSDQPHQFLAHSFRYFLTNDKTCQTSDEASTTIKNKIIQQSNIEIQQQDINVCIESFKSSQETFSFVTSKHIVREEDSRPYWIFGIFCGVIVLILLIFLRQRWKSRYRKVKASKVDVIFKEMKNSEDDKEEETSHQNSSAYSRKSSDVKTLYMDNGESGIGSVTCVNVKYEMTEFIDHSDSLVSVHNTHDTSENPETATESGIDSSSSGQSSVESKHQENTRRAEGVELNARTDDEENETEPEHSTNLITDNILLARYHEELQRQGFGPIVFDRNFNC